MAREPPKAGRKAVLDALMAKLPGVSARKINDLDAYFVNDRMFACIHGKGVALRLPVTLATELHFARGDVVPFAPGGTASPPGRPKGERRSAQHEGTPVISREWIQIDRPDAADYEKDLELFRAALEHVKAAGGR